MLIATTTRDYAERDQADDYGIRLRVSAQVKSESAGPQRALAGAVLRIDPGSPQTNRDHHRSRPPQTAGHKDRG